MSLKGLSLDHKCTFVDLWLENNSSKPRERRFVWQDSVTINDNLLHAMEDIFGDDSRSLAQCIIDSVAVAKRETDVQNTRVSRAKINIMAEIDKCDRLHMLYPGDANLFAKIEELQEKQQIVSKAFDKKAKEVDKAEKGEKPSRSLFNRAKPRLKKIPIPALTDPVTKLRHTDSSAKLRIATAYWSKLFTKPDGLHTNQDACEVFFKALKRRLNRAQAGELEHKLTKKELFAALDNLQDSTPGATGLTPSFYKTFWDTGLGDKLTSALNDCISKGTPLPHFMREARVVMLYKDGNVEDPANYRPISLLNTAYKIYTTALCMRLADVAPDLISRDQIGFMCNRFIGEVPLTLNMVSAFCKENKIDAGVLICDQQKAYDSVLHDFMEKFLGEFGFGDNFRAMVMLCYKQVFSAIVIDSKIGPAFPQTRGVRQGCPLSCLLFDLCMECLSGVLDTKIAGIPLDSPHVAAHKPQPLKAKFFADDTSIFFTPDDEISIARHMRLWTKASGMKWHPRKTRVLWLGTRAGASDTFCDYSAIAPNEVFKLLGVYFDSNAMYSNEQWEVVLAKLADRLPLARVMSLSIFGRAMLANSFAASLVWFPAQCLVVLPKRTLKRIEQAIFKYLWRGKKVGQVARKKCIGPKVGPHGGTGLINITDQCTGMQAMWVRRLLDPADTHYKTLFFHFVSYMTYPYNLYTGIFDPAADCIPIPAKVPESFKTIMIAWRKIGRTPDRSDLHPDQIGAQNIFYNSHIKISGEPIGSSYIVLAKGKVTHITDLFHPPLSQGRDLLTYDELLMQISPAGARRATQLAMFTYEQYLDLLCAIPPEWLQIMGSPPLKLQCGDFVQWVYSDEVCQVLNPDPPLLEFREYTHDFDQKLAVCTV